MIYAMSTGLITFLVVLGSAGVIAIVAFLIYLSLKPKLKEDDKPSEEAIAAEEMNRILVPVEDEETARAIATHKDEDE